MHCRIALCRRKCPFYAPQYTQPTHSYFSVSAPPMFSSVARNVSMYARIIHISNKFAMPIPLYYPYPLLCNHAQDQDEGERQRGSAVREPCVVHAQRHTARFTVTLEWRKWITDVTMVLRLQTHQDLAVSHLITPTRCH